jgi:hypothetical protein
MNRCKALFTMIVSAGVVLIISQVHAFEISVGAVGFDHLRSGQIGFRSSDFGHLYFHYRSPLYYHGRSHTYVTGYHYRRVYPGAYRNRYPRAYPNRYHIGG